MDFTRLSVPWQDRMGSITEALCYMLQKEIVVDAVFKRNGVPELYAHKLVLSLWSPVFAKMVTKVDRNRILDIPFEEDTDVVEAIIKFMYLSDTKNIFSNLPIQKLIQASEFSKRYEIEHIYQKCMNSIHRRKICPRNVVEYFNYGIRENHVAIINKCIKVFKFEGISSTTLKGDILLDTVISILDLDRVAVHTEARLLSLAISWLSYPENKRFKSPILSNIDLESIEWTEYKHIFKKFPCFFSNSELSALLLGMMRQDSAVFPEWYKPKIKSVVENSCSSCISVYKQLKFSTDLHFFRETHQRKDSTKFCIPFQIVFDCPAKARLLTAELNFGPNEISEKNFALFSKKGNVGNWKNCLINNIYGSPKYSVFFQDPVEMKSGENFTLKFNFRNSAKDKIHVILPNVNNASLLNKALSKDCVEVKLLSKVAFYISKNKAPKFLVSSFKFNFCSHHTCLIRKHIISQNTENAINREANGEDSTMQQIKKTEVKLEFNIDNLLFKNEGFKMNTCSPKFKIHSKDEDFKMDICSSSIERHSDKEDCPMDIISTDYIKKEVIELSD